jgi:HEAT repeat protein
MEEVRGERERGEELIARARLEKDPARKLFFATQAMVFLPEDPRAWIERGKALLKTGMINEAEEQILEVVRQNPDEGEGWYLHGIIKNIRGERGIAKSSFQKATGAMTRPGPAHYALGRLLLEDGEYKDALRLFDAALGEDRRDPDIWFARGRALLEMKRFNQAIISFDHLLEIRPGDEQGREARRKAIRMMKQDLNRTEERDFTLLREEADYPGLVRILSREKNSRAMKAAHELIRLGTGSTPYIRPLLSNNDPEIRFRALHVLLAIGDPRCAGLFVRLALSMKTPEEGGGEKTATLLDAIGRSLMRMRQTAVVTALGEALAERDEKTMIRSIRLVERTHDEQAVSLLIKAATHPSIRVAFVALTALGTLGNQETIDQIFTHLMSHDSAIRGQAKEALRQVIRRSLPPLMIRYASGDEPDRAFIREILHSIGGDLVPVILRELARQDTPAIRDALSDALASTAGPESVRLLIDALASPEEGVRQALPDAFRAVGVPAIHPLMKCLLDPRRRVRERAEEILAGMGRTAIPSLLVALESEDDKLRSAASDVLTLMGTSAVPALQDALLMKTHDSETIKMMNGLISGIQKKERMNRLLAEYRGEEPL